MVEVMFTTAPLFASAIAAKSGSTCAGAPPAACAPAGDGAVAPWAAWVFGSDGLEQPPARMTADSKQTEKILAFMGSPRVAGLTLDGASFAPFKSAEISSRRAPRESPWA